MPSQTLRLAAFHADNIDIGVTLIFGAKRYQLAVGRKMRIRRLSLKAGEPSRCPAPAAHNPDVVGVGECNMVCTDGRRT